MIAFWVLSAEVVLCGAECGGGQEEQDGENWGFSRRNKPRGPPFSVLFSSKNANSLSRVLFKVFGRVPFKVCLFLLRVFVEEKAWDV